MFHNLKIDTYLNKKKKRSSIRIFMQDIEEDILITLNFILDRFGNNTAGQLALF